ncbi:tol-pal system protein YbgF [Zhongshania sp.]|uniref:tol-pal system protein YbgF n=1 Tax=Zhongshania sp. TaxID=1971902 RepID=UPI003568013E
MQFTKPLFLLLPAACLSAQLWAQAPVVDMNSPGYRAQSGGSMQAEIYQQLQQLRQEMMTLRGIVEEQEHQISQLKQQGLDRYIDLDRRLGSLTTGAAGAVVGSSSAASVAVDAAGSDAGTTGAGDVAGAAVAVPDVVNPVAVNTAPAVASNGNDSSDYTDAYALVRSGNYDQAITSFLAYVERYPSGRYTPNAWYWLGELYVAVKPQNLKAATDAFQYLLSKYPDHDKVPAAMYKLGTVYFLNGNKQKSQELLTHVIDRYGSTGNSAVNKSREFLRKNF